MRLAIDEPAVEIHGDCFTWMNNRSTADRLCLEHYNGLRSLAATLKVAKRHYNNEVLAMVTADLSEQTTSAA